MEASIEQREWGLRIDERIMDAIVSINGRTSGSPKRLHDCGFKGRHAQWATWRRELAVKPCGTSQYAYGAEDFRGDVAYGRGIHICFVRL